LTHIVVPCSPLENPTPYEFFMFSSSCFVNPPTPHRNMGTNALLFTIVLFENSWKGQVTRSKNPHPPLGGRGPPKQEDENTKNP
jgi:hypothetical protein